MAWRHTLPRHILYPAIPSSAHVHGIAANVFNLEMGVRYLQVSFEPTFGVNNQTLLTCSQHQSMELHRLPWNRVLLSSSTTTQHR